MKTNSTAQNKASPAGREAGADKSSQTELSGTIAREFIQCADETGRIGDFLATNARRRVSPTFGTLGELYTWANDNGWISEGGARVYRPRGEALAKYDDREVSEPHLTAAQPKEKQP